MRSTDLRLISEAPERFRVIDSPALRSRSWLRHGFTTRGEGCSTVYSPQGDLNLGFTPHDDPANVHRNRASALQSLGLPGAGLFTVRQVHGSAVFPLHRSQLDPVNPASLVAEADAIITAEPELVLGIQVADCVPVLLADTRLHAVAAIHAGWRGTAAAIVSAAIARMASEYGSRPHDLVAAIGPSIGPCCYTVGEELHTAFRTAFSYADDLFPAATGGLHLDLWQANRRQLLDAGLAPANIHIVGECTACTFHAGRRKYFSHRAEQGFTGRALGLIGIASPAAPTPLEQHRRIEVA